MPNRPHPPPPLPTGLCWCCVTFPTGVADTLYGRFVAQAAACADRPLPPVTYESSGGRRDTLGTLRVEAQWASARPHRGLDDITLCTHASLDRLEALEAQCGSWGGPVSAAVWLPLELLGPGANGNSGVVEAARRRLTALHARLEERGPCKLDMVLLSERLGTRAAAAAALYPANALRNQALARARSKLVLELDVDMLPKRGLHAHLLGSALPKLLHSTHLHRDCVVIPAFETAANVEHTMRQQLAHAAARSTKRGVWQLYQRSGLRQLSPHLDLAHRATHLAKWFGARAPYAVLHEAGYEPYCLLARIHAPWHDERFRGYGWDKVMHSVHLALGGAQFVVHPAGHLVHLPHAPSAAFNASFSGPAYTQQQQPTPALRRLGGLARDMLAELRAGSYPLHGISLLSGCRPLELLTPPVVAGAATAAAAPQTPPSQTQQAQVQIQQQRQQQAGGVDGAATGIKAAAIAAAAAQGSGSPAGFGGGNSSRTTSGGVRYLPQYSSRQGVSETLLDEAIPGWW